MVVAGLLVVFTASTTTAAGAASPVRCMGHAATIVGASGQTVIHGTAGPDVIVAQGSDVRIHGGGGDDQICDYGQRGGVLHGGTGDDRLFSSAVRSTLLGGPGNDDLRGGRISSDGGRWLVSFDGGAGNDVLVGTNRRDSLTGGDGNDTIIGRGGFDGLTGGPGSDLIRGGDGVDYVDAGGVRHEPPSGADVVHLGPGADFVDFDARDRVFGGPGADQFSARFFPGVSRAFDGGGGANVLHAVLRPPAPGSDWSHVRIDLGRGVVNADGRVSTFSGVFRTLFLTPKWSRAWTLVGTSGDDFINAVSHVVDPGSMVLRGLAGADLLQSGPGDDVLWGGVGNDVGFAGGGVDICHSIEGPAPGSTTTDCETSTSP